LLVSASDETNEIVDSEDESQRPLNSGILFMYKQVYYIHVLHLHRAFSWRDTNYKCRCRS